MYNCGCGGLYDADIAVVATCQTRCELPDEIQDFYEDLAGLDLKDKLYGGRIR